jgi:hypothetical protein
MIGLLGMFVVLCTMRGGSASATVLEDGLPLLTQTDSELVEIKVSGR